MTMTKINTTDIVSLIQLLESLDTVDSILENSVAIYCSDIKTKKDTLENLLRFGDLSLDQLYNERTKLNKIVSLVTEGNKQASENTINFICGMKKLVDTRLESESNPIRESNRMMIDIYENDIKTRFDDVNVIPVIESTYHKSVLENLSSVDYVTPHMILDTVRVMITEHLLFPEPNKVVEDEYYGAIQETLMNNIKNTVLFEVHNNDFRDLPTIKCLGLLESELSEEFADMPDEIQSKITDLFNYIGDELETIAMDFYTEKTLDEGINPDPFNIYQMTPFSVGTRSITRTLMELANAETDEQIEECLVQFGRMCNMCKAIGPEIVTEAGNSKVAKIARKAARKSDDFVNGPVKKLSDEANDVKTSMKKVVDPMEKFIESSLTKIRKADEAERRRLVAKGGWGHNVLHKVWRWIKRGIGLLIVGKFGNIGALIAGISLIVFIITDAYFDSKVRVEMLQELEDELQIVEEKIEDSKGDENRQKKYELMRIRNKLKVDIKRVSLRLKY